MNTPKRWIETESGSSELERELLRPGLDVEIPAGAEDRVWMGLATLLPISAIGVGASLSGGNIAAGGSSAAATAAGVAGTTGGSAAVATGIGKIGLAMAAKAFVIGATSGALVAGGYTALDASRENPPAERTKASDAVDRAPPSAPHRAPNVSSAETTVTHPNRASPLPAPAIQGDGAGSSLRAPGGTPPAQAAVPPSPQAQPLTSKGSFAAWPAPVPQPGSAPDLRASRLGEEALVLKRARDAIRAGDLAAAFAALEAARSQFPQGALGEEREALTIQLLAQSGQRAAARARAESFLRSFPNSPHAPRVREIAGALPP